MSTCQAKIRILDTHDGIFQCRRPYGHPVLDDGRVHHVATGLYEYQVIEWLEGDRRQFIGDWAPCQDSLGCALPADHEGDHVR